MEKAADNYDNGTYTDRPTGTYSGDAVTEWVFNEERQEGDLTLIESGDNYYVVLFHSRGRKRLQHRGRAPHSVQGGYLRSGTARLTTIRRSWTPARPSRRRPPRPL